MIAWGSRSLPSIRRTFSFLPSTSYRRNHLRQLSSPCSPSPSSRKSSLEVSRTRQDAGLKGRWRKVSQAQDVVLRIPLRSRQPMTSFHRVIQPSRRCDFLKPSEIYVIYLPLSPLLQDSAFEPVQFRLSAVAKPHHCAHVMRTKPTLLELSRGRTLPKYYLM